MSIPQNPLAPTGPAAPGAVNWGELMENADNSVAGPIPNGAYAARVDEASDGTTSTGKTMFKVTFVVTDGEFANRKLWSNITVSPESPKALGVFFSQMAAMGLDQAFFASGPSAPAIAQSLLGAEVTVSVSQREWSGTIRNEVKGIRPLATSAAQLPAPGMAGAQTAGASVPAATPVTPPASPATAPKTPF